MKKSIRIIIIMLLVCVVTGLGIMLADRTIAKADGYYPDNKRLLCITGPVEIHVHDTDGRLAAEYIEGVSENGFSGSIRSGINNTTGEWSAYLPQNSGYNVEIIATSDGTIDVIFERMDIDYNIYYVANYYDIAVKKGDILSMDYMQEFFSRDYSERIEKPVDPVLKMGDTTISPSVEYRDEVPEYTIKVSSNKLGGMAMNYSSHKTPGRRAIVCAAPYEDCSFTGWYEGDELVSTEEVYTFRIESDRELVAHFEGESAYGRNGVFRIKIETEGDGFVSGDKSMFALDAYPVEISAFPLYGNEFVKWEVTGDCIIEDVYSSTTIIKTTTEDVKLKAVFRALEKPEIQGYLTKEYNIHLNMGGYEGAIGYRVYVKEPGSKKYRKLGTVQKAEIIFNSYSYEAPKSGKYKFKVKAYKKVKGKKVWSEYSNVVTLKVKKK